MLRQQPELLPRPPLEQKKCGVLTLHKGYRFATPRRDYAAFATLGAG
jgi:hypothetical protein